MSSTTDIIAANSQQTGNRFVTRGFEGLKHKFRYRWTFERSSKKKLEALTSKQIMDRMIQAKHQRQQETADQQQHVQPKQPLQQPVFTYFQLTFRTWRAR